MLGMLKTDRERVQSEVGEGGYMSYKTGSTASGRSCMSSYYSLRDLSQKTPEQVAPASGSPGQGQVKEKFLERSGEVDWSWTGSLWDEREKQMKAIAGKGICSSVLFASNMTGRVFEDELGLEENETPKEVGHGLVPSLP